MNETSPNAVDKQSDSVASGRTPWHLWVIGVVGLLWNSMGVLDFVMTMTKNETYMGGFTQEQLDFFYGFPTWVIASWAVAVFGALIGMLALLCRSKLAVPVFVIAMIAMVITAIHNYGFDKMLEIGGTGGVGFTAIIFAISLLLVIYSMAMQKRGVLT